MQRNVTWLLTAAALLLFGFIYFFERKIPSSADRRQPQRVLPFATVDEIRSISLVLAGGETVEAQKTNGAWVLIRPRYPARQMAIETFATNLVELRAFDRIPPGDAERESKKSFGLEPPRAIVDIQGASNHFRFEIGGPAPLTSNLYVRLPRSGEIVLANADLLAALPRSEDDWRTPSLFQLSARDFDRVQVRSGQRSFELVRGGPARLWQISKPVPARADQDRVLELLQVLRTAEATAFVTEAPGADLERFGLQSPQVEVSFAEGADRLYALEFGAASTNRTNQVFARLLGQTNVVLVPAELVEYLKQPYKTFHDPRLVTIEPEALDRIVVRTRETFTLQKQSDGRWTLADASKTPVDRELLAKFVEGVRGLRIFDIVKEVPTEADLKALGFTPPFISYTFFEKMTKTSGIATNMPFTELTFGVAQADKVHVRRSDEAPIYQTALPALIEMPKRAFQLRDRALWRFPTNAVAKILLSSGPVTNVVERGANAWSADSIANAQLEEIVFRLARLDAQEWVDKGAARLATFGVGSDAVILTVELRSGERHSLRFGRRTLRGDAYAAMLFEDDPEPVIFEFPGDLFQMMSQALPFPKSL